MAEDGARVQTDIIQESTGLMYDVHRISQRAPSVVLTWDRQPKVIASELFDYLISTSYNHQDAVPPFLGLRLGMTQGPEVTDEPSVSKAGKSGQLWGRQGRRERGRRFVTSKSSVP